MVSKGLRYMGFSLLFTVASCATKHVARHVMMVFVAIVLAATLYGCGSCHRIDANSDKLKNLPMSKDALHRLRAEGKYGLPMPPSERVKSEEKTTLVAESENLRDSDTSQNKSVEQMETDKIASEETTVAENTEKARSVSLDEDGSSAVVASSDNTVVDETSTKSPKPGEIDSVGLARVETVITKKIGKKASKEAIVADQTGSVEDEEKLGEVKETTNEDTAEEPSISTKAPNDADSVVVADQEPASKKIENEELVKKDAIDQEVAVEQKEKDTLPTREEHTTEGSESVAAAPSPVTEPSSASNDAICSPGTNGSSKDCVVASSPQEKEPNKSDTPKSAATDSGEQHVDHSDNGSRHVDSESNKLSRPWPINLGIVVSRQVDDAGALVKRVVEGSLGETIGIKPGDHLLEIDDIEIRSADDLRWSLLKRSNVLDILVDRKHAKVRLHMDMIQNENLYL